MSIWVIPDKLGFMGEIPCPNKPSLVYCNGVLERSGDSQYTWEPGGSQYTWEAGVLTIARPRSTDTWTLYFARTGMTIWIDIGDRCGDKGIGDRFLIKSEIL